MQHISHQATPHREGICVRIDPAVALAVRRVTAERGAQLWWVLEHAVRAGLPLLPPPGFETDLGGLVPTPQLSTVEWMSRKTRPRGRPTTALFAKIHPEVVAAINQDVEDRDAHHWWVVEQALRLGLNLLPPTGQEVLPQSA
jgi:hypothetical protein